MFDKPFKSPPTEVLGPGGRHEEVGKDTYASLDWCTVDQRFTSVTSPTFPLEHRGALHNLSTLVMISLEGGSLDSSAATCFWLQPKILWDDAERHAAHAEPMLNPPEDPAQVGSCPIVAICVVQVVRPAS